MWTGPGGIIDGFFPQIFGRLDPEVPVVQDVHRIIADGEYAVAEWTTHARTRDGRFYDSDYAGVFRVVDGHLAGVTEYLDTAYASGCSSAADTTAGPGPRRMACERRSRNGEPWSRRPGRARSRSA